MRLMILAITVLAIPASSGAQDRETSFRYNAYGYTYFSAGTCQHGYFNVGAGGGGEAFIWRGLTLGADLGYYNFPADRTGGYGAMTLNTGYHFVDRKRPRKFDPYVNCTVLGLAVFPGGRAAAGHLGAGVNYWFKERIGLQTGARIQVVYSEALVVFQAGVTFR